ncbi:diguanylate cyclase with PAS/PAC and GAF sensors [Cylindrospermum sp. NIES-4074]|nr:diguanylate cyclase with PAS/PAC and GAF sensors [Cylindrospermum sp. NIES-4074]
MLLNRLSNTEIDSQQILYQIRLLIARIHQSLELSEILKVIVSEVKKTLESDRVVIYRFLADGDGVIVEESVNPEWKALQGQLIYDPCLFAKWLEKYQAGQVSVLEDIDAKPLDTCYKELLTRLQIRANLVVPILVNTQDIDGISSSKPRLWGLLIAHQCSSPRQWSALEIEFLQLVATELGIALQQVERYQQWAKHNHKRSPQFHQNLKNIAVQPKQNFRVAERILYKKQKESITTETTSPKNISVADLMAFDRLQSPIWIYDIQNLQMWWVNKAALHIWNAQSREELLNRNFSDVSESTHIQLQHYLHEFQQGKTIAENWTFYPEGKPVSVHCLCSGVPIEDGRMAMLVEGTAEVVEQIDQEILRAIEALRHTTLIISLYTLDGVPLMQNPAALHCYGDTLHPNSSTENIFLRHFVDKSVGQQAMEAIKLGEMFSIETEVLTTEGIRWHGMDIRCTRDPVTGNSIIFVNEKDITKQQTALQERQRAEEELRWQETLLRSMTDTSLLAFYVVDNRTDEILYFNHRLCEIWGIEHLEPQMQLGALKNNDIIPDCIPSIADLPAFIQSCKPLQSEENRCTIEDEIVFVDGRTIRRFSSQIRDGRDRYFGRLYIFEDISDRKQLEKSLRLADYSFERIGLSGTWIDKNARILRVNDATCKNLGYSRAELESMQVYDFDPDFPKEAWAETWQALKQQKHLTLISRHQRKDGRCFPVEITINYVEFDGEEYNFAFSTDISERIQAETALRESEQRYRSVITAMAEGIVLQQADGEITACNDSAERILGLTTDQMMGRTSIDPRWQAIHEDGTSFPGETHPAIVTLRTGQPQFNVIMGVEKPDSSLSWVSINSQPLFKPDESKPYAVVASFTDITVRKQAELALQQQTERERMILAIAQHIRQSLDLEQILNTTVAEVRHFLQTDRVVIYRFNPDWSGVVVTESVAFGWQPILNREIIDNYFVETQGRSYQQGMVKVIPDIYTPGFSDCYVELLAQLQVRAKLVVPILQGNALWGLLVAHHCSAPREWQPWESQLLQQLATQVAIAIQQSELHQQLQLANQQLQNLAMVDQLTQIANRRCFDSQLDCTWGHLLREQGCLSLLLCDIDFFKQYNDTYGHAGGDDCLRLVAQAFKQTIKRSTDVAARYGGEEFVVILPNTDSDGALQVAQEIHEAIQQLNIPHAASVVKQHVTLSIGIATVIPTSDLLPLQLIEAADQALYQAKAQGRNRSCINRLSQEVGDRESSAC